MHRRKKSGTLPDSFHLRWHSFADPTTPSVDLMSSPDPLNDPTLELPPSTRLVARTTRSQSFGTITRRRLSQLQIGDGDQDPLSPGVLPGTKAAGVEDTTTRTRTTTTIQLAQGGTRRKLFSEVERSPTMRRLEHTTTTTVPLRDPGEDDDDDEVSTSRRPGRWPKPNGTPLPRSGLKRRVDALTDDNTPRRQRTTALGSKYATDAPLEDATEFTPRVAKRGRLSRDEATETPRGFAASPQRLGSTRTRRSAMLTDATDEAADADADADADAEDYRGAENDDIDLLRAPGSSRRLARNAQSPAAESDIWLTTMDDQPTPRTSNQSSRYALADTPSRAAHEPTPPQSDDQGGEDRDGYDYGFDAPAASDKSDVSDSASDIGPRNNDTIAQGEDFSMIFMDSIPSLAATFQGKNSYRGTGSMARTAYEKEKDGKKVVAEEEEEEEEREEELGDETNLIINNTLESIRQQVAQSDASDAPESIEGREDDEEQEPEDGQGDVAHLIDHDEEQGEDEDHDGEELEEGLDENEKEAEEEQEGEEEGEEEEEEEEEEEDDDDDAENAGDHTIITEGPTEMLTPAVPREPGFVPRLSPSPWWSRKAKKLGSSPLRHQVLRSSIRRTSLSAEEIVARRLESLTPTRRLSRANGGFRRRSLLYEDTSSDISLVGDGTPTPVGLPLPRRRNQVLDEKTEQREREQQHEQEAMDDVEQEEEEQEDEDGQEEDEQEVEDVTDKEEGGGEEMEEETMLHEVDPEQEEESIAASDEEEAEEEVEADEEEATEAVEGDEDEVYERGEDDLHDDAADQEEPGQADMTIFEDEKDYGVETEEEGVQVEADAELDKAEDLEALPEEQVDQEESPDEQEEFGDSDAQDDVLEHEAEVQKDQGPIFEHLTQAEGEVDQDRNAQYDDENATEDEIQYDVEDGQFEAKHVLQGGQSSTWDQVHYPQLRRQLLTENIHYGIPTQGMEKEAVFVSAEPGRAEDDGLRSESPLELEHAHMPGTRHNQVLVAEEPRHSGHQSTQLAKITPVNQMSSPVETPESTIQESFLERAARPILSSIVRAGRVLQNITSDPPSPGDHDTQLGSPFRSSGSKESQQAAKDLYNKRLLSKSPPKRLHLIEAEDEPRSQVRPPTRIWGRSLNGSTSKPPPSIQNTAHLDERRSGSKELSGANAHESSAEDEAMSWIEAEEPLSPSVREDISRYTARSVTAGNMNDSSTTFPSMPGPDTKKPWLRGPANRETFEESFIEEAPPKQQPSTAGRLGAAGEETEEEPSPGDDETDIWEFEARRDSPHPAHEAPAKTIARSDRNGGDVPSARANRLQSGTRRTTTPKKPAEEVNDAHESESDEAAQYSMIASRQPQREPEPATNSRFDLSAFFSSPAAIPGMLAEKFFPSRAPAPAPRPKQAQAAPQQADPITATNSMFPQLPPKTFSSRHGHRTDLFSPQKAAQKQPRDEEQQDAEKQTTTPALKHTDRARFLQSSVRTAATATPIKMQLSHADISRWQQETSYVSDGSPDMPRHILRPLPAKNASPKKSSLRSPLKPRTPGRVVEFSNSVLSPLDQAAAREPHLAASHAVPSRAPMPQAKLPPAARAPSPVKAQPQQADAAEEPAPLAPSIFASSKPAAPPQPQPQPQAPEPESEPEPEALSGTTWSRKHWLLLDSLLRRRRQRPLPAPAHGSSNSAEKLLGKTVRSQGKALRLERWHLDCVEAFQAQVAGWDEAALAKRLVALILGEERRQRMALKKAVRTTFH